MAEKENKAETPQSMTETPVPTGQNSSQDNPEKDAATKQSQASAEQPTSGKAARNATSASAKPAAKTPTKKAEQKVSDSVQTIGKALLKSNPDMSVVYMTADGSGFYEKNDAENHARTLNNKVVTPVKR